MQGLLPQASGSVSGSVSGKTATPASGDLEKDYGAVISDLETVARKRAGTTAAAEASILLADTYLNYKKPERAVEFAQLASEKLGSRNTLSALARVLWGTALADQGDCQKAVGIWQDVLDRKELAYLHGDVSLRAGLCFEKLNQNDKASEMYRKASLEGGKGSTSQTAKTYLRALEFNTRGKAQQ